MFNKILLALLLLIGTAYASETEPDPDMADILDFIIDMEDMLGGDMKKWIDEDLPMPDDDEIEDTEDEK